MKIKYTNNIEDYSSHISAKFASDQGHIWRSKSGDKSSHDPLNLGSWIYPLTLVLYISSGARNCWRQYLASRLTTSKNYFLTLKWDFFLWACT